MLELVLATRNRSKLQELEAILAELPVRLVTAVELGAPEVVEDRDTLAGNAEKKALVVAAATGRVAIADDTGLEVDALGGEPGVRSARFAGEGASYADNNRLLLERLAGVPPERRTARFRSVVALARPAGPSREAEVIALVEGVLEGAIGLAPRGAGGFGYDPLFLAGGGEETLAELGAERKNRISHRARALERLKGRVAALVAERRSASAR